jgi:hypothetical protein
MAAGAILLDVDGKQYLQADGQAHLSDGAGDECCCGGGESCECDVGLWPSAVSLDITAAFLDAECDCRETCVESTPGEISIGLTAEACNNAGVNITAYGTSAEFCFSGFTGFFSLRFGLNGQEIGQCKWVLAFLCDGTEIAEWDGPLNNNPIGDYTASSGCATGTITVS